jgi:hypothetical protein
MFRVHIIMMLIGSSCMESGIIIQSEKQYGWKNRGGGGGRVRDGGGGRMGRDHFESDDETISDDAMDVDNHIVNPNEF